ncbi:MAG: 4Fe-4S dicluster domain-containing protein [Planctomycetota bacterium]
MSAKKKKSHAHRVKICGAGAAGGAPRPRGSRASRWRAAVLAAVHVAIAAHLAHWAIAGRTLSPVEPSEAMYTLELGHVNAGFILLAAAALSTLIFGRFFCGWGCHIVALQDLCGWLMKKVGIRPRLFRSRLLAWVPFLLAAYMFAWPNLKRLIIIPVLRRLWPQGVDHLDPVAAFPGFSNHLMKEEFWETFASWQVGIPFLLICGFGAVYFLGAKGFCTYGCPYGAIFAGADRLSPGRIVADLSACEKCGHCTATCTSNVQVHREIQIHRQVVSPGCMKCLDCVSVCPKGALSFGIGPPALFSKRRKPRPPRRYDLSLAEEILVAAVFFLVFRAWRNAYELVPMLMAVGIAGCRSFAVWKGISIPRLRNASLHRFRLKRQGRILASGWTLIAFVILSLALTLHCEVLRTERSRGDARFRGVQVQLDALLGPDPALVPVEMHVRAQAAIDHYRRVRDIGHGGWGLLPVAGTALEERLGYLHVVAGDLGSARRAWSEALDRGGPRDDLCLRFAQLLARMEGPAAGAAYMEEVLDGDPRMPQVRALLTSHVAGRAAVAFQEKRLDEAIRLQTRAAELAPSSPAIVMQLAQLLRFAGREEESAARRRDAEALLKRGGRR